MITARNKKPSFPMIKNGFYGENTFCKLHAPRIAPVPSLTKAIYLIPPLLSRETSPVFAISDALLDIDQFIEQPVSSVKTGITERASRLPTWHRRFANAAFGTRPDGPPPTAPTTSS